MGQRQGAATILLHMGIHKTGSTTLQKSFALNRERLAGAGVVYLGTDGPYPSLYSAFLDDPMELIWNRVSRLDADAVRRRDRAALDELEAALAAQDGKTVVLSSEHLPMLPVHRLCALRDFLERFGTVRAVYFHRDLPGWIASNSQQMARAGIATEPTPFPPALERVYDYPLKLAEVFGRENCRFVRFETAVKAGICNSFLRATGLPDFDALGLSETIANRGISGPAVEALYAYNRIHPTGDPRRDPAKAARLAALPGPPYRIEGFFPDEIRTYSRARDEVQARLGLELAPPQSLPRRAVSPARRLRRIAGQIYRGLRPRS